MKVISVMDYQLCASEAEFQATIVELAKLRGWVVVHVPRMQGNPAGLPDLLLWREDEYQLIEVKNETGKRRPSQERWANDAARCGVIVHLVRPSDWLRVQELLA